MENKKVVTLINEIEKDLYKFIIILKKNPGYTKALSLVTGKHGRHLGKFISVEYEAMIKLYTANIFIRLNKALRGIGNVKFDKELKAMQKILDDALSKLPIFEQGSNPLQRSAFFTEAEIKKLFKEGKDFVEKGFMSTTYSEMALKQWLIDNPLHNVIFKVYGKNGKLIEKASMLPWENEVLFRSGTTFIVDGITKIKHPIQSRARNGEKIYQIVLKEK